MIRKWFKLFGLVGLSLTATVSWVFEEAGKAISGGASEL